MKAVVCEAFGGPEVLVLREVPDPPPLDDTDETPKGFYLRRIDGVPWLRGYWSWPGHLWSPEDRRLFARDLGAP